ncbi:hypothetical protein HK104_001246 [Borealophlyctis nickersoniae]|nr:hypothetical protein HK104_001246 [Borealophlyctis nickersoniae]
MADRPFSHRSTLKQQNKPFKSRHATKGTLKAKTKGKVDKVANAVKNKHKQHLVSHKADRRNAAKVAQQKKKEDLVMGNRLFQGIYGVPKIVAVVPLCPDVSTHAAVQNLFASAQQPYPDTTGPVTLSLPNFKQRLQLIPLGRHTLDILDALKVADFVIFVMSANVEVDDFGTNCLTAIKAQGLPSALSFVQHLETHPAKMQTGIRRSLTLFMEDHFPGDHRIFSVGVETECVNALRYITSQRPKPLVWRDRHAYICAEGVEFEGNADDASRGTLKVTGYVRGNNLSANRLVHIPAHGDFQIKMIVSCPRLEHKEQGTMMPVEPEMLQVSDPQTREPLVSVNEPDPMEGEQTWPTAEELMDAEERVRQMGATKAPSESATSRSSKRKKRLVPKGTSSYQAAWIIDDEDEDGSEEEEEEDDDGDVSMSGPSVDWSSMNLGPNASATAGDDQEEYEELEEVDTEDKDAAFDAQFNAEKEHEDYEAYLKTKQKESNDDLEFPDEVDTPQGVPARVRFQRYRGLQSFRTSPWDPYENLPIDYSRIFQIQNFKRTKKRVLDKLDAEGVIPGTYVTVHIQDVPREVIDGHKPTRPFVCFTLLPHEQKYTVLNFLVKRTDDFTDPVKSKDPLVLHCGFRRYIVRPLYSQHTQGQTNNVHKFERFLQKGAVSVATVYAPIQFGPAPVLMYRHDEGVRWDDATTPPLVATGSVLDLDPTRILAKRIVLTGHPFKVHKRGAVVRYMFWNPEDIAYFRPVQLTTKMGRTGHIRESLGTHGYMKCLFDAQLKAQDTVCMNLYKRVFPKWNTELFREGGVSAMQVDKMEE